jgi:hypothetical protein
MTKRVKKFAIQNDRQLSLFDLLKADREDRAATAPGRLCCSARLRAALVQAIKAAPKSREAIADQMSELTGAAITVHNLNSWTAESHPHRMPAEYLPAFCIATGSIEAVRMLAEASGAYALPGEDALRSEVQKLREQEQRIAAERRKRELFLKEICR